MRTVSPGFGGVLIGAAMVVSLAYAMGDGSTLTGFVMGLVSQTLDMTADAIHSAAQSVSSLL